MTAFGLDAIAYSIGNVVKKGTEIRASISAAQLCARCMVQQQYHRWLRPICSWLGGFHPAPPLPLTNPPGAENRSMSAKSTPKT